MLCTDGVWSVVSDADIARACALPTPDAIRAAIDRAAHDAQAPDDVSIAVAVVSEARDIIVQNPNTMTYR